MGILKNAVSACIVAGLIGTSAYGEPAEPELCQSSVAVFIAALDAGHPADVYGVLSVLLEGADAEAYLATLPMDQAKPWFEVLFHPALVNSVVSQSDAHQEQWSALADILEAAYAPPAATAIVSG